MPLVVKDRVQETSTTVGTGTYTLAGAVTGYQSFSVVGNGNQTYYAATDGTNWETGIGTYTSAGTTLSRDAILESSNAGAAVSWGAGTKNIFVTYPADATPLNWTTTATAAGTTTLTNSSAYFQFFTGTTTQTVVLPVVSTLAQGWTFHIVNNSTGNLTINSSGGNLVITGLPGTTVMVTCILTTGTTAASWEAGYTDFSTATGTGNVVLATAPTLTNPVITGGSIDNTPIGATTPNTIAGTNISSATAPTNTVPALALTGTPNNAAGGKTGVLAVGPNFTASDKNIMATFVQNINDYTQIIVQNPNSGTAASADFIVNNDNTTGSGTYGDFGINSSAFSGTGALSAASAVYLYSNGGDLAIGTNTANQIRFVTNNSATDTATVSSAGAWTYNNAITLATGAATAGAAPLYFRSGTNLSAAAAGAQEYDGAALYFTTDTSGGRGFLPTTQTFRLTGNGSAITTIANFFGATSNISLVASAFYDIEIIMFYTKTTAGTVTWTLTNSAAPTSMQVIYESSAVTGIVAPGSAAAQIGGQSLNVTTAAYTITTASVSNNANMYTRIRLLLQNGTGTNLKIQATAGTGSLTPLIGSQWFCRRLPGANTGTFAA